MIALCAFGIQRFLYKVSAEKKCNTAWTTFAFMGTVAILSSLLFFVYGQPLDNIIFLIFISFINSASFLTGTITTIEALKSISTSVAYPVIRLNTAIVVIFSIVYFKDKLSVFQVMGIILAITVIFILTRMSFPSRMIRDLKNTTILSGLILKEPPISGNWQEPIWFFAIPTHLGEPL